MNWLGYIFMLMFLGATFYGIVMIMQLVPQAALYYTPYDGNISLLPVSGAVQFYPEMRYPNNTITYTIGKACTESKAVNIRRALDILSANTSLVFIPESNGEITYLCSDISPNQSDESHIIAGEGGPTKIINTTTFSVILAGQVSLYRPERCQTPNIAIHETLHALGFDHVQDPTDIMYPVTDCNKYLKQATIDAINKLYSYPSEPDLAIDSVSANQTGRYLNFHITIMNHGLKNSLGSNLTLYSDGNPLRTFILGEIDIGTKKFLDVQNMYLQSSRISNVTFLIQATDGQADLFPKNNFAKINLIYKNSSQAQ